ncbi:MAG: hypothetical protein KGI50_04135 [Patescibacteria group bacterium]|nr:hypothetical protein [Patescibacteria group bacterium]MDE2438525.1 hypothetical protein [Patescibacteria group bacterium]
MIRDFLPEYSAAHQHSTEPVYTILRSIVIDGHEVAWIQLEGTDLYGKQYRCYDLYCECYFTRGIGWDIRDGKATGLSGDSCIKKRVATFLRHCEIQQDIQSRFPFINLILSEDDLHCIIYELMQQLKTGSFINDQFLDGTSTRLDLRTLEFILDHPMHDIYEKANALAAAKKIKLDFNMVYACKKPSSKNQK